MSVGRAVVWFEPWVKLPEVPATWTPRPIWIGLVPPRWALPAEPAVSIWLSVSWKTVLLLLKPVVLALAMLLPVTSSIVWLTRRPLMPEKRERSMRDLLGTGAGGQAEAEVLGGAPAVTAVTEATGTEVPSTVSTGPVEGKLTPLATPVW